MERKSVALSFAEVKANSDKGEIEAIVNTGNLKDRQGDVMMPGCWAKVIREKQAPAICWGHDVSDVRGKVTYMEELPPGDPRIPANAIGKSGAASGLLIRGLYAMKTQAGREAFELVKDGFINQWSVQFSVADNGEKRSGDVREIKEVDELFEVSNVLVGASPMTATTAVKSQTPEPIKRPAPLNVTDIPAHLIELPALQLAAVQRARRKFGISE